MPELIPAEPGTPEWHAARRLGVTATDIVTVCGLSRWDSAYALYWRKLGQVPGVPDSDRFRLGRELELYVMQRWCEAQDPPVALFKRGGLYRSTTRPWQMATPDGTSDHSVFEGKTWASADVRSWEAGPPPAVRAQVLWQMDVMDVPAGHVGVLFLPSGEFRSYVIEHNTSCVPGVRQGCTNCEDQALMRVRGEEFWRRLRGELPPPSVDGSEASLAALRARFGDVRKDKAVEIDANDWADFQRAAEEIDRWTEAKRAVEAEIREQVGEAGRIEVGGELVAHHLVYDAQVKAHTRHVDMIRRVKKEEESE